MSDRLTPTEVDQAQTEHGRAAERHVAELVRAVDVRAPQTLHRRVQEMVDTRPGSRRGAGAEGERKGVLGGVLHGRLRPTLAAMVVAAIAGAALALLTGGGTHRPVQPAGPSLSAATQLTLGAATTGAPRESAAHAGQLNVAVDGVAFPYWEERFGWRASGTRTDTIGGRSVRTVFYSGPRGRRIGYAIVGGTPAPATSGGTLVWHRDVAYRLRRIGAVPVVTWQRDGRLCVLSGRGVSGATLVRLASWSETGTAT
ncbi:MAG TPA: hypothetical protein VGI24_10885 [Solirubrobacteraceae bacterium]|jgi:hypothetical protein